MQCRHFGSAAVALCGLTLSLLTAPAAHAQVSVIASAKADANPTVTVLGDGAPGRPAQSLPDAARTARDLFANATWAVRNDGLVVASKGTEIILGSYFAQAGDTPNYVLHTRGENYLIDGWLKATGGGRGTVQLVLTFFDTTGVSVTINCEAALSNFTYFGATNSGPKR